MDNITNLELVILITISQTKMFPPPIFAVCLNTNGKYTKPG